MKKYRAAAEENPMAHIRIYFLVAVTVAAVMLLVQMHIVANLVIDSNSSIFRSEQPTKDSGNVQVMKKPSAPRNEKKPSAPINEKKPSVPRNEKKQSAPKNEKKGCDEIVDSDKDADEDLKPILKILCRGGYDIFKNSTTVDRSVLPKWSEILDFYGPPKILGLETCSIYRNRVKQEARQVAPAGLFNTGTNLLDNVIYENCDFQNTDYDSEDMMTFQVPWGKHFPFSFRLNHTAWIYKDYEDLDPFNALPVVSVKDPYTWMQSMCKQPYSAQFDHDKSSCPNIVPYESDIQTHPRFAKMKHIPVHVKYDKTNDIVRKYESMAHLWNEWNSDYIKFHEHNNTMKSPTDFPFIVVRLEDLTFHGETIIPQICECAGGTLKGGEVKHFAKIANQNHAVDMSSGKMSGLLRSIVKYGNITRRRDGYPDFQLEAAKEVLDPRLMNLLRYPYEEIQS